MVDYATSPYNCPQYPKFRKIEFLSLTLWESVEQRSIFPLLHVCKNSNIAFCYMAIVTSVCFWQADLGNFLG